jgi:hypothetical protein
LRTIRNQSPPVEVAELAVTSAVVEMKQLTDGPLKNTMLTNEQAGDALFE